MLGQIKDLLSDFSGFIFGIRRFYTVEISARDWNAFECGETIHRFVDLRTRLKVGTIVKYQCFQHTGKAEVVEEENPIYKLGRIRHAFRMVLDAEELRKRRES